MDDPAIRTILIVDDEIGIQESLGRFLFMEGYEARAASHGEEALDLLAGESFDLIISDIKMPGMDGIELMRAAREAHPGLEFIIMTGHAAQYSYADIIGAGAADFLVKPFQNGELKAKLDRVGRERVAAAKLKAANEDLARKVRIHSALSAMSRALLTRTTVEDISRLVLACAMELTESPSGLAGFVDRPTGSLVVPGIVGDIWGLCHIEGPPVVLRRVSGLCGWSLESRLPVLTNAPSEDPRFDSSLPGVDAVRRVLAVPTLSGERLLGEIVLGNSPREYSDADLQLVTDLAAIYALAIERRWTELDLERANERLKELLDERTRKFNAAGELLRKSIAAVKSLTDDI